VEEVLKLTENGKHLEDPEKEQKVKKLSEEIDKLVYKLYGLTEEEIKLVEEEIANEF
jgi:ABC-type phosphate transport system auxiliary subunit